MLTTLHVHHPFLYISFPSLHDRDVIMPMGCKTVRIFAYWSTREQSNKRSGTRLKTESKTGERRWKYDFFLSPHTPYGHVRLASFARVKTLTPRFTDFFTDFQKNPAVLQSIMPTTFFFFPWTSIQSLALNSRKNCQHLTNWTRWNKQYKVCSSATSLFISDVFIAVAVVVASAKAL